jgi:disulfide bond formation protein DsbB
VWSLLGVSANAPVRTLVMTWLIALTAGFGAFVAARQSWLQWYPPEVVSCGRDFYGMIENFPLQRAVPMIFKGSGDCTKIDWTFLGGSIANWSFVVFMGIFVLMLLLRLRDGLFRTPSNLESLEPLS